MFINMIYSIGDVCMIIYTNPYSTNKLKMFRKIPALSQIPCILIAAHKLLKISYILIDLRINQCEHISIVLIIKLIFHGISSVDGYNRIASK